MHNFHFLGTSSMTKIDGHKHPQAEMPIIQYHPDKVYIQTCDNRGNKLQNRLEVGAEVKVGTVLGIREDFGLPVYSSVSGKIVAFENKMSTAIGRPVEHFVIENDKTYSKEKLSPLEKNYTKESVVNKIKEGAIVGLGGAGFPTFIKYNTRSDVVIDTILVNAIECEPYLTTDYLEGSRAMEDMFYALPILLDITKANKVIVAIKENKKLLIDAFDETLVKHPELSGKVERYLTKDRYPMGFERTLIKTVLNRTYNILPSECKVIENNLQTLEAVGRLFRDGEIISKRLLTIAGEGVAKPMNVEVPVGTIVRDIITANGGYAFEEIKIINGGPMCGRTVLTDDFPVLTQAGGYTILRKYDIRTEACWKCGKCVDHCPMGLQPVQIQMAIARNDFERCHDLEAEKCVECGLCSFVCPSHIDVTANVSKAKTMARIKFKPGTLSEYEQNKEKVNQFLLKVKNMFKKKDKNETNKEEVIKND